ncbi:Thiol-disulfide oxidoreductase ResA [Janthinobacterium sp. KBS0711]|uniref:TlpA family protein disulfide reductase n=1 Tax=Janthinobacterium sp. KBS0711 TaxID=1649647 RepID=UPI0006275320|nr:TlpA disulfide reductase family protein [Janthinobacterium sp. KBS0711]KKO62188.1 Thiol-disulfide oxidoreductase ResA [Janthinobacterium sp. KBS0711]TSD72168.1 TlpA family protein disulfide reductase [Janthinobacterium sp. KBS0711]
MTRWPALLLLLAGQATAAPLSFDLARLDGDGRLKLGQFQGQAVVLNFWASNCQPCLRELPILHAHAARQPGLPFIGIAIDTRAAAQAFLRLHPASYPQALASPALLPTFGNQIKGLPYTVILTSQHRICTRRLGPVDAAWLAKAVATCA